MSRCRDVMIRSLMSHAPEVERQSAHDGHPLAKIIDPGRHALTFSAIAGQPDRPAPPSRLAIPNSIHTRAS
jgi:hypothetical protein